MKVLMISTDRKIFEEESGVRQRVIEYGALVDELHIVVFCKKSLGFSKQKISKNTWAYSTNSMNRWMYVFDAIKISEKIIPEADGWLVTTQDPFEAGIVGWRIAGSRKTKLQLQIHTDFLSPYFARGSFLNNFRVKIAKFLLPKSDCTRVVSKRIVDSIKSSGIKLKTEPEILPIFVDIETIRKAPTNVDVHTTAQQFDAVILMVSRLEKEKNIPLALSVFRKVVDKHPKTGLVITGEGSKHEVLKLIARSYKLESNVIFKGESDDVLSFYKTADIFLHTSNYEGYGIVLVEAAVSDCPIVTTDVGIASEYFKDAESAYICDVSDENCLADRLIRMIENKEFKNTFALKAQNAIEKNVKEKTREQYLKRYKELWEKCFISDVERGQ